MSNTIKYSEGSESLALNKGNWWIGTGDSNKGPTVESGYWNAINPPDGGYTVYLNKETNGPSIHSITSDENLISFTNKISGNNYTTVAECLVYYQTQDDKLCVNKEYENIVTDGLVLNLDAGYVPSYPTSGTTWYDLSGGGNDGSLVNGPTYSGGSMVFDGTDDWLNVPITLNAGNFTYETVMKQFGSTSYQIFAAGTGGPSNGGTNIQAFVNSSGGLVNLYAPVGGSGWKWGTYDNTGNFTATTNVNYHIVVVNLDTTWKIYVNGNLVGDIDSFVPTVGNRVGIARNAMQAANDTSSQVSLVKIYNRALSSAEILQNFKNSGPQTFSSCKTCKEILDNFPQLGGFDGYYWVYPGGPTSTPYRVYCDMTTDGGGWMLVARSHPSVINYNGKNWGWKGGSIGNVNDHSQSYQLGWGEIWDSAGATFTSFIFGNQRTSIENSWGPFVYKVSGINYSNFFGSDTQQGYSNSTIKSDTSVYGSSSYPGMQRAVGFTTTATNNNLYYMRDCCGFAGYGGSPNQMVTTYCGANFYYSGPWCGGSTTTGSVYDYNSYVSNGLTYGGTNQYMIMVR